MLIDGMLINEEAQFIFARWNRIVNKTYKIFFYNRAIFGAYVEVNFNKKSVAHKYKQKYKEFNGSTSEFLALNKNNFVLQSWDISEVVIDQKANKKTGFTENAGIIELHMRNGTIEEFVLFWTDLNDLVSVIKNEVTDNVVVKNSLSELEVADNVVTIDSLSELEVTDNVVVKNSLSDKEVAPIVDENNLLYANQAALEDNDINIPLAIVFGLVAAVIASALWYGIVVITDYQLGLVAVVVGWVIAKAVILGSGNKQGTVLQIISAFITFITMMLSEFLIIRHVAVLQLAQEGITGIPLFFPINEMADIVIESIKENPITLFFWIIAVFEAYKIPARTLIKQTQQIEEKQS